MVMMPMRTDTLSSPLPTGLIRGLASLPLDHRVQGSYFWSAIGHSPVGLAALGANKGVLPEYKVKWNRLALGTTCHPLVLLFTTAHGLMTATCLRPGNCSST